MTTIPLLHPAHAVVDLAARVAAFFIKADPREPRDWEIAQYGTQTFRRNTEGALVLVATTPELTYGQLRGKTS